MDLEQEEANLRKANDDLAKADARIRKQETLLATLERDGHNTAAAIILLDTLRDTRRVMAEHRRQIVEAIEEIKEKNKRVLP